MFDYYSHHTGLSPFLVKFGQGAAPPEAYMQKSSGKKSHLGRNTCSEARWLPWLARTFGISGSGVHRGLSGDSELGTRLGGHSELGAMALLKAVWCWKCCPLVSAVKLYMHLCTPFLLSSFHWSNSLTYKLSEHMWFSVLTWLCSLCTQHSIKIAQSFGVVLLINLKHALLFNIV